MPEIDEESQRALACRYNPPFSRPSETIRGSFLLPGRASVTARVRSREPPHSEQRGEVLRSCSGVITPRGRSSTSPLRTCGRRAPSARNWTSEACRSVSRRAERREGWPPVPPLLGACLCHSQSSDGNSLARSRIFGQITSQRMPGMSLNFEAHGQTVCGSVRALATGCGVARA